MQRSKSYKGVVDGFRSSVQEVPSGILVSLVPRDLNLPKYNLVIIIVYGATCMCTMSNISCYVREVWRNYSRLSSEGYKNKVIEYSDISDNSLKEYVCEKVDSLVNYAEESLQNYVE